MNPSPTADGPRRLHPSSPLFRVAGYVRQLIVPVIVALFASGDYREAVFAVFAVPLGLYEILHYFRTTYHVADDQLIVRRGVLFHTARHIPLDQIQNVDLTENLLHRLLRVAEVRIETASGAEPEAVLRVLGLPQIEPLREQIRAVRSLPESDSAPTAEPDRAADIADQPEATAAGERQAVELLRLSPLDLVKLGLITFRGLVVVAVALGAVFQFDIAERFFEDIEDWTAVSIPTGGTALLATVVGVLLFGLVGVTVLSVLWAVVTLYDFCLVRTGEDLRVTCGLFTRLSATIPRPRIQFLSVRESLLHRWFGTVTVSVETAGGSGEADSVPLSRRWLVPLVPQQRLEDLLHEIQPEFRLVDCTWQGLSAAGRRRMIRKTAVVGGLLLGSIVAALEVWLVLMTSVPDVRLPNTVLAWLIPVGAVCLWLLWLFHARAAARAIGYAQHAGGIAFRSGYLNRRTSTTNYDRIQVVGLAESPFDRRWRMATLSVDTAGAGPAGHRIQIACLDRPIADALHRETVTRTEQAGFRWHR